MKLKILLILLFFTTHLIGQKNEFSLYSGMYTYDWLENPRNRFIEGSARIFGVDYTRMFFSNDKLRLSCGAGIRNLRSNNFKSAFMLQDSTVEIRNVTTNSYYGNILFKAEFSIKGRLSALLLLNNLVLIDKGKDFIHQNRFHSNIDVGFSYAVCEKISLGVTSQLNLFPIGSVKGSLITIIGDPPGQTDYNIRPGGLGLSLQLMYRF